MKRVDWPVTIKAGKIEMPDREQFVSAIAATFGTLGQFPAMMTVEKIGQNRTHQQLKYLFGGIYAAAQLDEQFGGWIKEDLHGYFKEKFLRRTRELGGKIVDVAGSTKGLNTEEMTDFVEHVRRELAEMGIYTTDPNEGDPQ